MNCFCGHPDWFHDAAKCNDCPCEHYRPAPAYWPLAQAYLEATTTLGANIEERDKTWRALYEVLPTLIYLSPIQKVQLLEQIRDAS